MGATQAASSSTSSVTALVAAIVIVVVVLVIAFGGRYFYVKKQRKQEQVSSTSSWDGVPLKQLSPVRKFASVLRFKKPTTVPDAEDLVGTRPQPIKPATTFQEINASK